MSAWRKRLPVGLLTGFVFAMLCLLAQVLFWQGDEGLSALAMLVVVLAAMMVQWRAELFPGPPTLIPISEVESSIRRERIYARAEKLATLDRLERYVQQRRMERDRK